MKKCFGTSLLPRRKNDESVLVTLGFDVLAWIMHKAESATQNRPLNFELAAFFCAWKKAIQTSAIKNIK